MPRLQPTRSRLAPVILYPDSDRPIEIHLDTTRTRNGQRVDPLIQIGYLPAEPGNQGGVAVDEWTWANGTGGAGTTIETRASYLAGACEYGEFVWLRQLGKAQPAGKLRELTLPVGTAGVTTGWFTRGRMFGTSNDFYLTTRSRYLVKVPLGTGTSALTEIDFGAGRVTVGVAVFAGTNTSCLYVGDSQGGIHELNGSTWTNSSDVNTAGGFLETVYWTIGSGLATGGLAGTAGTGGHRLIVTHPQGTGFYHVAGDPKDSANWSALTRVGTGGQVYPIQSLAVDNRTAWFGTGLGVFAADELGYTPNLTKWVELIAHTANGTAVAYWNELIWVGTEQGLSAFRPDGTRVDFGRFLQFGAKAGTTPIYGRPRALAPCEAGLYVGYYNEQTGDSYVGILLFDDDGSYRWSMAEAVIPDQQVTFVQQVSGNDNTPRLFIGTLDGSGSMHLYTQSLPRSGDPENDFLNSGPFEAAESWSLTLSRTNGGRAVSKTWRRWMLEADQLGSDYPQNTVEFQVATDGGAFATQGTATDSPRWSAQPRSAAVQGTSAQVKLAVTNTTNAPVVIRSVGARYSSHPELTKVLRFAGVFGEGVTKGDPKVHLARLEHAQRAGPIAIQDMFGNRLEGIVEPGIGETVTVEAVGNSYTVHADVTISYSRQVTRFDRDDLYDTGVPFS